MVWRSWLSRGGDASRQFDLCTGANLRNLPTRPAFLIAARPETSPGTFLTNQSAFTHPTSTSSLPNRSRSRSRKTSRQMRIFATYVSPRHDFVQRMTSRRLERVGAAQLVRGQRCSQAGRLDGVLLHGCGGGSPSPCPFGHSWPTMAETAPRSRATGRLHSANLPAC